MYILKYINTLLSPMSCPDNVLKLFLFVITDPCQVELCVCVRLDSDVPETSPTRQNPATTVPCSHSNRVCSHSEDSLEPGHCVLGISEVVKINIFPQETASRSFNVFGGP